jgi:hypothetical protein
MYRVISLGPSDEKFAVGRNEYNRDGKIAFVRLPNTFKSRSEAEKLAAKLNGKHLVDH